MVTFKIDNKQVKVGQDIRVEYEDKEKGLTLIVVLSHEGIIMDVWEKNAIASFATSSIMFDEKMDEMLEENGYTG